MSAAKHDLFHARSNAVAKVNEALAPLGKKLWHVSETNSYKLMRLLIWSERHCVTLDYVIGAVIPALSKAVERRTMKKSKGLGISIPVLTGDVAEDILKERIAKDFPAGEHIHAYRDARRNELIAKLDEEGIGKPRSPLAYSDPDDYIKAYVASIKRKRKDREELEEQIAAMPFRRNPFR